MTFRNVFNLKRYNNEAKKMDKLKKASQASPRPGAKDSYERSLSVSLTRINEQEEMWRRKKMQASQLVSKYVIFFERMNSYKHIQNDQFIF